MSRIAAIMLMVATSLVATGCNTAPPAPVVAPKVLRTALPADNTSVVVGKTASELAIGVSRAIFRTAPAVVLIGADDAADLGQASDRAQQLGVPVLLTPASAAPQASASAQASRAPSGEDAVRDEINRLAPKTIVAIGGSAKGWIGSTPSSVPLDDNVALADIRPDAPLTDLLVLAVDDAASRAATATAKAAGARILTLSNPDPRTDPKAIDALSHQPSEHVLAIGSGFGSTGVLRGRIDTAATGVMLPGGGQVLFPYRRMVALYGHPGSTVLGSLGEQPVDAAVARAKQMAAQYSSLVKVPVIPTFEIIATVASAGAGSDGDYSSESSIEHLQPWVDAATQNGMYVVLDLQPGLTDFLTQAKRYSVLLEKPNVGLALDPEWRLKPGQRHMQQIGSVDASEINATAAWLADLTRQHHLPQKVLLLHQFTLNMITNRSTLDTSHDELQVLIHADGFGSQAAKMDTWHGLHLNEPPNVWWGWKNFIDEDKPMATPAQTYAVKPQPVFVSYQ